jgi:hypothetical protein
MVLRLIRALPGEAAFLAPVADGLLHQLSARVAAPGPHDFTVRGAPSSGAWHSPFRRPCRQAPEIAASIASCALRIVTIAKRPSVGARRQDYATIWVFGKAEYFSICRLTGIGDLPVVPEMSQFVPTGKRIVSQSCALRAFRERIPPCASMDLFPCSRPMT